MELSNGLVSFDFDDDTGNLLQISDLSIGKEHLSDPRGSRLFRLIVPTTEHMSRPLLSHECERPSMEKKGDRLIISYPGLSSSGVSAKVEVRLPAGSREARFTIEITNDGPDTVHEVHFPWVSGWTGNAGRGKDLLTVAVWQIDPYTTFPTHRSHTFGRKNMRRYYGGPYFLPFADLSGGGSGISYCIYAEKPRLNGILVENAAHYYEETCLGMMYVGQPYIKPGQTWKSPEIGVGVHRGDWHDTVDRFRESLEGWWKPAQAPAKIRDSIGFHNVQFKGFNGEVYHELSEIGAIARDGMKYGVSDLCVWDLFAQVYTRPDAGGFWEMPSERIEELKKGLAEAKELGCNTSTLVNFRLATERSNVFGEIESEIQRSLYGYPLKCEQYYWTLNHAKTLNPALQQGSQVLCQCSPKFHKFAIDLLKETLDLGFTSLFIDQATDWNCCFDEGHGHTSPDDTIEGAYRWAEEAVKIIKSRGADAYSIGELPEVFNTPIIDVWWDWDRRTRHPEVLRYLFPESIQAYIVDENEKDVIAPAFAMGHIFATMTRNLGGLLSDEPEFASRIARLASLRKQTLDFLAHGRFLDNRGLAVEGASGYTFVSDAGLAVALGNSENKTVQASVELNLEKLGFNPASGGMIYSEDGTAIEANNLSAKIVLPPYGAAVWIIPGV